MNTCTLLSAAAASCTKISLKQRMFPHATTLPNTTPQHYILCCAEISLKSLSWFHTAPSSLEIGDLMMGVLGYESSNIICALKPRPYPLSIYGKIQRGLPAHTGCASPDEPHRVASCPVSRSSCSHPAARRFLSWGCSRIGSH